MHRRMVIMAAVAAFVAACSRQQEAKAPETDAAEAPDPAAVIRPLYDPYLTQGAQFPEIRNQAPWSDDLWAQLDALVQRSNTINEPILDFDPLIDAQDYQLTNLNVTTDAVVPNSHAVVRAQFENAGRPSEVVYDLIWEDGGWRVDNIRSASWDLRAIVAAPSADAIAN